MLIIRKSNHYLGPEKTFSTLSYTKNKKAGLQKTPSIARLPTLTEVVCGVLQMQPQQQQRPPSRASHASRTSEVSRGAASLYSVGSVHSVRSSAVRSTVPLTGEVEPWKPPVLKHALLTSIPKASHVAAVYSIVSVGESIWVLGLALPLESLRLILSERRFVVLHPSNRHFC